MKILNTFYQQSVTWLKKVFPVYQTKPPISLYPLLPGFHFYANSLAFTSFFSLSLSTHSTSSSFQCSLTPSRPASHNLASQLSILSLSLCFASFSSSSLFLFLYDREQWQRPWAVCGATPAWGSGTAAGSDQIHQEGVAVPVQGLQKCKSLLKAVLG